VIGKHFWWNFPQLRYCVKVDRIITFDGHVVGLTHFELDESIDGIVFDYVCYIILLVLSAIAVRLVMFDNP